MNLADITVDMIRCALREALEEVEGSDYYYGTPWTVDMQLLADPYQVIYQASNGDYFSRTFTLEIAGDAMTAILSSERIEVESRTVWIPLDAETQASFSFSGSATPQSFEGKTEKSGLLFKLGDYPDKAPLTADNLRKFVANFPPEGVVIMSEHEDSLIGEAMKQDGAKVVRVWTEKADTELHGVVEYPNWLAYGLRKLKNSVSIGLNRALDSLIELSLVKNPRVADAAVFRHDAALAFSCTSQFSTFAAAHPSEAARIVTEVSTTPVPAKEDMDKTTITQRLQAFFAGKTPEQRAALTDAMITEAIFSGEPATPAAPQTYAIDPALRAEIDALQKNDLERTTQFAAQTDANDAAKFYLEELRAGRSTPADEADVLEQFGLARFKDRHSAETFSANAEGSAERALRERLAKRPVQFRFQGQLPSESTIDLQSKFGVFTPEELGVKEESK